MKTFFISVMLATLAAATPRQGFSQNDGPAFEDAPLLTGRWVGLRRIRALWLEFYSDTMLVANDRYALEYRVTPDSLIAWGDTTIVASYQVSHGWLLLYTPEGEVITMSPQTALARPLIGRWLGDIAVEERSSAQLQLLPGSTARWRHLSSGEWVVGEWDRSTRNITFVWEPDSTEWLGFYDPGGNAILFETTVEGSSTTIFRRWFR